MNKRWIWALGLTFSVAMLFGAFNNCAKTGAGQEDAASGGPTENPGTNGGNPAPGEVNLKQVADALCTRAGACGLQTPPACTDLVYQLPLPEASAWLGADPSLTSLASIQEAAKAGALTMDTMKLTQCRDSAKLVECSHMTNLTDPLLAQATLEGLLQQLNACKEVVVQ